MYALVDCNNFYASCERVFRPDLVGTPIVVLSNNDGCVIARSAEAKELDIPMGMPAYQYENLFVEKGIAVFSSNYALYGDMSRRVVTILGRFSPDIEVYSIDESFLRFEGFNSYDLHSYGYAIKREVLKTTGIPVSVGIAPTKALAKLANRIAKDDVTSTNGVYVMQNEEERIKAIRNTPVGQVWGIGKRLGIRLNRIGVATAFDFTELPNDWVRNETTVVGLRLKRELEGKPTCALEALKDKKAIATTRSFQHNQKDYSFVKERISTFAFMCSEKLRAQGSTCREIEVFVRTNKNRLDLSQYHRSIRVALPYPTNSGIELSKFATTALQSIFREGVYYKKAGVIVKELSPDRSTQTTLFEETDASHKPLMEVIDRLNWKYGQHKVRIGSQATGSTWKMKRERLSPCYTTRFRDMVKVKV